YLRRRLRSLDEIPAPSRDNAASQKKLGAAKLGVGSGASARAADTPDAGAGRRARLRPIGDPPAADPTAA
ncbi:MAG: hypothetical protein ACREH6_11995, partial [Geminicoccaceae bacterium]